MSFITDDLAALKAWWHTLIDHLISHPAATPEVVHAQIAAVAATVALPPAVKPSGNPDQDRFLASYLASGTPTQPVQTPQAAPVLTPDTIYYDHHQLQHFVVGGEPKSYPTEPVQGGRATVVVCTYCEHSPERVKLWADSQPEPDWMNTSSAPTVPLGPGTHTVHVLGDGDGLVDLQLRNA